MSGLTPVVVSRTERGLEVHIPGVPGWEGFDKLTRYLEKHFDARVTSSVDGPDARIRHLRIGLEDLTLDFEDPFGSTIVATDSESKTIREIATDLRRRLSEPGDAPE